MILIILYLPYITKQNWLKILKEGEYLSLLDVTDMQTPIIQHQLNLKGYPKEMHTEKNFSYVVIDHRNYNTTITQNILKIIDATDKENPYVISSKYLFSDAPQRTINIMICLSFQTIHKKLYLM